MELQWLRRRTWCMRQTWKTLVAALLLSGVVGCAGEQLRQLFDLYTPHERYEQVLVASGLDQTALGRDWVRAAATVLNRSVAIVAPYREESYFDPREAVAVAYQLPLRRGQRVSVTFESAPDSAYQVFLDLFLVRDGAGAPPERVASADSTARTLVHAEALSAATRNAGEYLNDPTLGRLRVGSRADLVVLPANPLDDISAVRRPLAVMANGRWAEIQS